MERWNSKICEGTPKAKAAIQFKIDTEERKRGEQTGLDTLVVHAVNDECSDSEFFGFLVNTLSTPPEEYNRKVGTQRN